MKGYELIKAIQENKIDSNVKFKVTNTDKTLDTIVRFDGVDIVYYDSGINIFDNWFLTTILDSDFKVIEEKKEIEELDEMQIINARPEVNAEKINELIRAVNKINKDLEELEPYDIEVSERDINDAIKRAREYTEREEK